MQGSHLLAALLAGVLVGGGVFIGKAVFESEAAPAPPDRTATPDAPTPVPVTAQPATLGGDEVAGLHRRIGTLEQRLVDLEAKLATKSEEVEPLLKLFERFKEMGMPMDGSMVPGTVLEETPASGPVTMDPSTGVGYARSLAKQLALDAGLTKSLLDTYSGLVERIQQFEKEHAKVTVEGDTTHIKFPAYPHADVLRRDWRDWLAANLTEDQRERIKRDHSENRLFEGRLGARDVKITESGGSIEVSANATDDDGQAMVTQMHGPAMARNLILEDYLHLLK